MKHVTLAILFCLLTLPSWAQNQVIRFVACPWEVVLKQARQEHKLVFVYAYSPGCHFCREMEATTFQDAAAATYYNRTFISYQVNITTDTAFARRYDIASFPTYLYLDETGKLLHRSLGAKPAAEFIADAKAAFVPESAFYALQRRYQAGERTADLLYAYSRALEFSSEAQSPQSRVLTEYLATQSAEQLRSEKNLRFLFKQTSAATNEFFLQNQAAFQRYYPASEVQRKAERILARMAAEAGKSKDATAFSRVRHLVTTSFSDTARAHSLATINFLEARRDWVAYAGATLRHARRPNPDAYTLRKTATYVHYFGQEQGLARQQEALGLALKFMPILLRQEKTYENTLLHAQLLHQAHQETQAAAVARAAVALAQQKQEKSDDATTLLAEIQTARKK